MIIARKWFASFNGFAVHLAASDDFDRSWQGFCNLKGIHFEPEHTSGSGFCRSTANSAECFAWVKLPPAKRQNDWTPDELASHELTHVLSHLCRWLGDIQICQADEPLAYTMASMLHIFKALIDYELGRCDLQHLRVAARDVDFELLEIPGLAIQP